MSKLLFLLVSAAFIAGCAAQQSCGNNEIYLAQGQAPNCDTVCSQIGKPCTINFIQAPSGCYCLPDHARNSQGACVPISQCPITCRRRS